jgi:hypothetical protein
MSTDESDGLVEILTERQRRRPIALPDEPAEEELVRDFSVSVADRIEIERCRGPDNQLGFALQLCILRRHGRFLTEFDQLPTRILNHLALQLELPPLLLLRYPEREATDLAHRSRIASYLGLRRFDDEVEQRLGQWLSDRQGAGDYDLYQAVPLY